MQAKTDKTESASRQLYQCSVEEVLTLFDTSLTQGLSENEAKRRLNHYGKNEIDDTGIRTWTRILWAQFQSSLVVLLLIAATVSIAVGEPTDAFAILAIVLLNTALGFWQDYSAENSLAELKKLSVPNTWVVRDGITSSIPANMIVPGDQVLLKAGYTVAADCRLLEVSDLAIDESTLTGESIPVSKQAQQIAETNLAIGDQVNRGFMGTTVVRGRAVGIATETGMHTELGKIANSLRTVQSESTPLQVKLAQLSRSLAIIALAVVLIIFIAGTWDGQPLKLMLMVALSLSVAIVPEGLPAVATVALALGARKMFNQNALVRQLPAVETLGSVSVICSDKTGTLTQNKMTATSIHSLSAVYNAAATDESITSDMTWVLLAATLCNDAQLQQNSSGDQQGIVGEPTEQALLEISNQLGFNQLELTAALPRINEIEFNSERKKMSTLHQLRAAASVTQLVLPKDALQLVLCKGAVDHVLEACCSVLINGRTKTLDQEHRLGILNMQDEIARRGVRVLAFAFRLSPDPIKRTLMESELVFAGFIGLSDPPRKEAKRSVATCKRAGIRTIMITGDHPLTARSIADQIGIPNNETVLTGKDLSRLSSIQLRDRVKDVSIFARVAPSDKLDIVEALEHNHEVVAMTGDGVNDAPALKQANVGVAMGITGTDVCKQAANIVLLDDNFSTIVAAIEQGRTVYDNIRKFVRYAMSGNIGEVFVMTIGLLFGLPLPLLPLQILWVNLVTDGLPGLALAAEPTEANVMQRKPISLDDPIFNRRMIIDLLWIGGWICSASLITAHLCVLETDDVSVWRTVIFTVLTLTQMANAFACRSNVAIFGRQARLKSNPWLIAAVATTFWLQVAVIYWPPLQNVFSTSALSLTQFTSCILASVVVFALIELRKYFVTEVLASQVEGDQ